MAAVDYFIKFDGIKGESTDAKHKDEVDVESWSWGETHTGPAHPAGSSSKVSMQDFQFMMRLNRASIGLMEACATGQHIKSATLTGRKAGTHKRESLTSKFPAALVSSSQPGGSEADLPIDQVALNFAKIQVEYRPQKPDGTL